MPRLQDPTPTELVSFEQAMAEVIAKETPPIKQAYHPYPPLNQTYNQTHNDGTKLTSRHGAAEQGGHTSEEYLEAEGREDDGLISCAKDGEDNSSHPLRSSSRHQDYAITTTTSLQIEEQQHLPVDQKIEGSESNSYGTSVAISSRGRSRWPVLITATQHREQHSPPEHKVHTIIPSIPDTLTRLNTESSNPLENEDSLCSKSNLVGVSDVPRKIDMKCKRNLSCPPVLPPSPQASDFSDDTLVDPNSPGSPWSAGFDPSKRHSTSKTAVQTHWDELIVHLKEAEQCIAETEWSQITHILLEARAKDKELMHQHVKRIEEEFSGHKSQQEAERRRLDEQLKDAEKELRSVIEENKALRLDKEAATSAQSLDTDDIDHTTSNEHRQTTDSTSESESQSEEDSSSSTSDGESTPSEDDDQDQSSEVDDETLQTKATDLEEQVQQLCTDLDVADKKAKRFEYQFRQADLECGRAHQVNLRLRHKLEAENREQYADIDSLIRQIDSEYHTLEQNSKNIYEELVNVRHAQAISQTELEGTIKGLEAELTDRSNETESLTKSRDAFKREYEKLIDMLKRKLYEGDALMALSEHNETLQTDNNFLINIITKCRDTVAEAEAVSTVLKVDIVKLEADIDSARSKYTHLQADNNSLVLQNSHLEIAKETQDGAHFRVLTEANAQIAQLQAANEAQAQRIETLIYEGCSATVTTSLAEKDNEIKELSKKSKKWEFQYKLKCKKAKEVDKGFCYFLDASEIEDWDLEDMRSHFLAADRKIKDLEEQVLALGDGSKKDEGVSAIAMSHTERMFGSKVFNGGVQWNLDSEQLLLDQHTHPKLQEILKEEQQERLQEVYGPNDTESVWDQDLGGRGRKIY